jgi:Tfp pilus assembly protein PilV
MNGSDEHMPQGGNALAARARGRTAGVSLMEVTIALTILGFGMLAGASAQLSAMRFSSDSRARMEAQYLAQQQMEILQAMTPTAIGAAFPDGAVVADAANPLDPDPLDGMARQYNRSWVVTRDSPVNGVFRINVQVSWTSTNTGTIRTVNLESLKSEF